MHRSSWSSNKNTRIEWRQILPQHLVGIIVSRHRKETGLWREGSENFCFLDHFIAHGVHCIDRRCTAVPDWSRGDWLCVWDPVWAHEGARSRGAGAYHSSGLFCSAQWNADEDIWTSSSRISQGLCQSLTYRWSVMKHALSDISIWCMPIESMS